MVKTPRQTEPTNGITDTDEPAKSEQDFVSQTTETNDVSALEQRKAELDAREARLNAQEEILKRGNDATSIPGTSPVENGPAPRDFTDAERERIDAWRNDPDSFAVAFLNLEETVGRLAKYVFGAGGG